ncbi:hypothetical protein RW79_04609, partial [Escherichia coli]
MQSLVLCLSCIILSIILSLANS